MSADNWTQIIVTSISLVGVIITGVLIPYVRTRTTKEQRENMLSWAELAVYAAEEIYKLMPKSGKEKHKLVEDYLKEHFKLSDEQIDIIIRAIVNKMNSAKEEFLREEDIAEIANILIDYMEKGAV